MDVHKIEDLHWELKVVETAKAKFKDVDSLYRAHHQITLPLLLLQVENEMHIKYESASWKIWEDMSQ